MNNNLVSTKAEWEVATIGDILKFKSGDFLNAASMDSSGNYPVYGGNGINGYHSKFMFEERKIVIGRVGVYCGSVHYTEPYSWITDNALYVAEKDSRLSDEYLVLALRFANLNQYASQSGQPLISASKISDVKIVIPPLPEQKRIASLLKRADRLRQLRRIAHALGDALLQSVFLEMFGDPFRNERGWERVEIADLIRSGDTINYGVVQPGDDFPNGKPIIRVGDLDNLSKDITALKLIDPKIEANYKRSRIVGDEILIACVGSIGRIALVSEKMKGFNIVRAVARVPADYSLVNRLYLATYLSMPFVQDFFQRETRTVSQPTLNITQIEETPVLLPPLSLQEEFASVVRRVESLRGRMSEAGRQVEGLFESLLAEAFS